MAVAEQVGAYLDAASRSPWVWGRHDCCQFVRGWVVEVTGRDPAAAWRYDSEMAAALMAHRRGGLVALFAELAQASGFPPTAHPRTGDIGIIQALTLQGVHPVGAIRTERGWAFLTRGGIARADVESLAAWRLHD